MRACLILLSVTFGGFAYAQDHSLNSSAAAMKDLLAQGFEIRSHQFYPCIDKPSESCVNVLMQKGAQVASCSFNERFWVHPSGSVNTSCTLFQ